MKGFGLSDLTLILLSAGDSNRFGQKVKKQWLRVESIPLWLFVTNRFKSFYNFEKIVITSNEVELNYMQNFANHTFVKGGKTRQESLQNALQFVDTKYVIVSDVARCCVDKDMLLRVISERDKADCVVPYLSVSDTVVYDGNTIDRDRVKLIQTPQLSLTSKLKEALESKTLFTDDSSAIKAIGGKVTYVEGSSEAQKLTFFENLSEIKCLKPPSNEIFNGNGFDVHEFENNKKMKLGGATIDVDYGFKAHSDGDVLIHSLIDALLGASSAGDIGEFFPDSDDTYKDIDSKILLEKIVSFINSVGFEIINVDVTIIAQKPRLLNYKMKIKENLAKMLQIEKHRVNVKATTTEKLGFIGRKEGVAVISSANLKFFNWVGK